MAVRASTYQHVPNDCQRRKAGFPPGDVLFEVEVPTKDDALTLGSVLRDMGQAHLKGGGLS